MKANKLLNSSRSLDDVRISSSDEANETTNAKQPNINEHQMNTSVLSIEHANDADKKKIVDSEKNEWSSGEKIDFVGHPLGRSKNNISKSVDNVSLTSGELGDMLDNVGSVELIFISDEFLNKVSSDQNVIILKNNPHKPPSSTISARKPGQSNVESKATNRINANRNEHTDAGSGKKIVVVSDDFCRKSVQDQNIVIVDEPKRNNSETNEVNESDGAMTNGNASKSKNSHAKLNRQSSAETSIDDVSNKITSRAFQSYDEEQEHLESKEIKLEDEEIPL